MITETKGFDIDNVPWGEPKIISTRGGEKQIREWDIEGEGFWAEWKTGKLKALGYSVSKFKGVWKLTEWRQIDGKRTPAAERAAVALGEMQRQESYAANYEPELSMAAQARFAEIENKLLDYQVPHVKRLVAALEAFNGAVDASDTGTGKTPSALAAVAALGMRALVICPKPVIPTWNYWAKHVGCEMVAAVNYEKLRTGKTGFGEWYTEGKKRWFVFEKDYLDSDDVVLIFDECHKLKDYKTQNCAMGISAIEQGFKVIALSATAADNPLQMKFVAMVTKLIQHAKFFFGWMTQNGVQRGRFGMEFVGGREVLSRIHQQIFPAHGSRIRIAELGDKFPETQIIAEAYDMDGASAEIQQVYDEMRAEIARLEERMRHDSGGEGRGAILVAMLRARQKVELLKVPTICSMAQDALEEGMSVAIFVNFDDSLDAIASRLKTTYVIRGNQKMDNRELIINEFRSDRAHVVVCNIKAGGVGVSLHGKPEGRMRLALISPTFSGQDLKQALGRVWRAGGAKSIQKIVFAAGTIEEEACDRVRGKIQRIDSLNDGELAQALSF